MGTTEVLHELFRAHGIECALRGEWVVFPKRRMRATASVLQVVQRPTVFTIELEVRFELASGRTIIEAFAGVGATKETAFADAVQSFTANSFHVLLAAFLQADASPTSDKPVTQEVWVVGGKSRRVIVGNVGVRGKPPVQGEQLVGWMEQFEQKLKQQILGPETHWVRLYYGQAQGKALSSEVLLDNNVWGLMQSRIADFSWPTGDDFYSMRIFLVIEGDDKPEDKVSHAQTQRSTWQFWKR